MSYVSPAQSGIETIGTIGPGGETRQANFGSAYGAGYGGAYGGGDVVGSAWSGGANAAQYGSWNGSTSAGSSTAQGSLLGMLGSLLQQLGSYLAQLTGANGGSGSGNGYGGYGGSAGATQYAQNATLSSTGDPHLAETGTIASGGTTSNVNAHFESMTSHADLVSTGDVRGGYQVSTTVTAPNANGVTFNQSATVTTAGGNDAVTMTNAGDVSITQFGRTTTLAPGASMQLTNGATVSRAADGSLTIAEANGNGGSISTVLRQNGPGVDVTTTAAGLRVGGDIVNGNAAGGSTSPFPPIVDPRTRYELADARQTGVA